MRSGLAAVALIVVSIAMGGASSWAGEVLSVKGHVLKWPAASAGRAPVVTFALLSEPYAFPRHKSTLSPENCGAMRPFSDIVATSVGVSVQMAYEELRAAMAAWEEVAGIRFARVSEADHPQLLFGATDGANGPAFANLSISDAHGLNPAAKGLGAQVAGSLVDAIAATKIEQVIPIEKAYVCLNPKSAWKVGFDGNLRIYDLRYTFTHEIGHAIGLDHSGSSGSIMGYRYDERVRTLQPSDISSARLLYGTVLSKDIDIPAEVTWGAASGHAPRN